MPVKVVLASILFLTGLANCALWGQETIETASVLHIQQSVTTSKTGFPQFISMYQVLDGAKSAASALSVICTRTVARAGSSVKATWRSACQGKSAISTDVLAIAMQGCGPGKSPPRAKNAATRRGTAEARILKRNMEHSLADRPGIRWAYGWRSVNRTRYRRVDGVWRD